MDRKTVRKVWENYMIEEYNRQHSSKYGKYSKGNQQIRDSGEVVVNSHIGKEVLEEVGMDYRTFRMKYNTMENPLECRGKKREYIEEV